ncbi:MAG: glutathione peroxidase [Coriobacteriales bacterium]|jgi:glutathione peroxidase
MGIYDFNVKAKDGSSVSLADFQGKVLLIINSATECGFTPQYKELEEMYAKYRGQGFEILDFPCNQFGGQAPGTDQEISDFCALKFGTEFPQFSKIDVNGPNADPLFAYLKEQKGFEGFGKGLKAKALAVAVKKMDKNYSESSPDIKWNFTKFLVDREGNVIARFEPTKDMGEVDAEVAAIL